MYEKRTQRPAATRAELVPEGVYEAELVDVQPFNRSFGQRIGLVFEVTEGECAGTRLMESAALSGRGRLADLVAGLGGLRGLSEDGLRGLIGHRCRVMVKHSTTRSGTRFASIAGTLKL